MIIIIFGILIRINVKQFIVPIGYCHLAGRYVIYFEFSV